MSSSSLAPPIAYTTADVGRLLGKTRQSADRWLRRHQIQRVPWLGHSQVVPLAALARAVPGLFADREAGDDQVDDEDAPALRSVASSERAPWSWVNRWPRMTERPTRLGELRTSSRDERDLRWLFQEGAETAIGGLRSNLGPQLERLRTGVVPLPTASSDEAIDRIEGRARSVRREQRLRERLARMPEKLVRVLAVEHGQEPPGRALFRPYAAVAALTTAYRAARGRGGRTLEQLSARHPDRLTPDERALVGAILEEATGLLSEACWAWRLAGR